MSETGKVNIHGFPGYVVSEDGRVFSLDRIIESKKRSNFFVKGRELKPGVGPTGYKLVQLGRGNPRYVHSLVAEAFLGPRPKGLHVRHLDGDRVNNRVENLAYGTAKENAEDAQQHGTILRGECHHNSKLTADDVREIKAMNLEPYGACTAAAKAYGVNTNTILDIKHGRTWRHV